MRPAGTGGRTPRRSQPHRDTAKRFLDPAFHGQESGEARVDRPALRTVEAELRRKHLHPRDRVLGGRRPVQKRLCKQPGKGARRFRFLPLLAVRGRARARSRRRVPASGTPSRRPSTRATRPGRARVRRRCLRAPGIASRASRTLSSTGVPEAENARTNCSSILACSSAPRSPSVTAVSIACSSAAPAPLYITRVHESATEDDQEQRKLGVVGGRTPRARSSSATVAGASALLDAASAARRRV